MRRVAFGLRRASLGPGERRIPRRFGGRSAACSRSWSSAPTPAWAPGRVHARIGWPPSVVMVHGSGHNAASSGVNRMKGIHPNRGTCTYLRIVRGLHLQSRLAVGQLHHQTESTLLAGIHVGASGAGRVVVAVGITSVGGSCERHGPGLALACCVGHTHTRLVAAVYRAVLRWKGSTHSNSRQTMSPPGPAAVQFRTGDEAACDVGI